MSATLQQLLAVRSHVADDVIAFCDKAVARLDTTGFSYKPPGCGPTPIPISTTVLDARVFTSRKKIEQPEDRDEALTRSDDHEQREDRNEARMRRDDDEQQPANANEEALADLNEHPWLTQQRETKPWSRVFAGARPGKPLVVRGAPGSGKTTLSRYSTIRRLKAVREALATHEKLPEECEPMLWMRCSDLADVEHCSDSADLVITAAFHALGLDEKDEKDPAPSACVRAWLRAHIVAKNCPLALDSLDELRKEHEDAFQARAPSLFDFPSPVVLTCRVVEWEQRKGWTGWQGREFDEIELAPLTRREQRDYARRFFREGIALPGRLVGFERALAQGLSLRKTCETPILLFFACLLHAERGLSGAVRRTELYHRMRRRLFLGEWRGLPQSPPWADGSVREYDVTTWLCAIALALFRRAPKAPIFSMGSWLDAVTEAGPFPGNPTTNARSLLLDLEKCGFLVNAGWSTKEDQPYYSFPHRSFLAFLAGAALAKRPREQWMKEVIEHLWFQPAWEDVILFLAGHLAEADVDALLEEIEKQPEDIFRQRLRWQWRIAGEAKRVRRKWGKFWAGATLKLAVDEERFCPASEARNDLLRVLGGMSDAMSTPSTDRAARFVELHREMCDAMSTPLDKLLKCLNEESDSVVRTRAASVLGKIGSGRAVKALLKTLAADPCPYARKWAASAIGEIVSDQGVEEIRVFDVFDKWVRRRDWDRGFKDDRLYCDAPLASNERVRMSAAYALGQAGSERAVDALLASLDPGRESDSVVRQSAAQALGQIGSDRAVDTLLASLNPIRESDEWVRSSTAYALGQIGGERAVKGLVVRLSPPCESDIFACWRAAEALRQIGSKRAANDLLPRFDPFRESEPLVHRSAASALEITGSERAEDALLARLDPKRETNGFTRGRAAEVLGQIVSERAVDALIASLDLALESESHVRSSVAEALGQIGGKRALHALRACLDRERNSDKSLRQSAANALFKMYWQSGKRSAVFLRGWFAPGRRLLAAVSLFQLNLHELLDEIDRIWRLKFPYTSICFSRSYSRRLRARKSWKR